MKTEIENLISHYLFGELNDKEMVAFEQRYFEEPHLFDLVTHTETDLLDDYARDRMPADVRERFKLQYMGDSGRRGRVDFARALGTKLDSEKLLPEAIPFWRAITASLRHGRYTLRLTLAAAAVIMVVGGLWLTIDSRRSAPVEVARTSPPSETNSVGTKEPPANPPDLRETAAKRMPTPGLPPSAANRPQPAPVPKLPAQPAVPRMVTFALEIGAVRGGESGRAPLLTVPSGTMTARLRLRLKDLEHASYRISLENISGSPVAARTIKPVGPVANLFLDVPAARLVDGEYVLTLTGVGEDGSADDLSKSLFRVKKNK